MKWNGMNGTEWTGMEWKRGGTSRKIGINRLDWDRKKKNERTTQELKNRKEQIQVGTVRDKQEQIADEQTGMRWEQVGIDGNRSEQTGADRKEI